MGNSTWSTAATTSEHRGCTYFHAGTVPNCENEIFATDIRMMVTGSAEGYRPVALYARRAREPLEPYLSESTNSWSMFGTNLSGKAEKSWTSDTNRLLLADHNDFDQLSETIVIIDA